MFKKEDFKTLHNADCVGTEGKYHFRRVGHSMPLNTSCQ
jgi:hypothetical protein